MPNYRVQPRIRRPYQPGSFARNDLSKVDPADVKLPDAAPPVWPGYGANEDNPNQPKHVFRNIMLSGVAVIASAAIFLGARMYTNNKLYSAQPQVQQHEDSISAEPSNSSDVQVSINAQESYPRLHAIPQGTMLPVTTGLLKNTQPEQSSIGPQYLQLTPAEVVAEAKARVAAAKRAIEEEKNPSQLEISLSLSSLRESRAPQVDNLQGYAASSDH